MTDYTLTATDIVVRADDGAMIPSDPDNPDRQRYDAWVVDGGVPDPYVPPPPKVPAVVSPAQMVRALDRMGLLVPVQAAVAASPDALTKALWAHTTTFHRNEPLIAQIAAALNKTDADVDALFLLAATF